MEIPELGQQCGMGMCQQLDFLPICCSFCHGTFCKQHFPPQYHDCTGDYDNVITQDRESEPTLHKCEFSGCKNGELSPVVCQACTKNFCLAHRHQVDHQCVKYEAVVNPMAAAAEKVKQLTTGRSTVPDKGQGRKSDKLAAKVQLMKLKQKSSGQTSLPQEERVYLLVHLPKTHKSCMTQAAFVSHHWTIGRTIDAVAEMGKVANKNNVSGADKLILFRASDGSRLGPMDGQLKPLLDHQLLFSGQSLILEYQPQDTEFLEDFKTYKP